MTTALQTRRDRQAQSAFEREQRLAKHARIRRVSADNPDLTLDLLAERFGESPDTISRLLPPGDGYRRFREDGMRTHRPRQQRSA